MTDEQQKQLNEQVARLLGWTSEITTAIGGVPVEPFVRWRSPLRYQDMSPFSLLFGSLPDFTRNANWLPVLWAEVQRRALRAKYLDAIEQVLGITEYPMSSVDEWALLTATPEQHCRAFVEVCSDAQ